MLPRQSSSAGPLRSSQIIRAGLPSARTNPEPAPAYRAVFAWREQKIYGVFLRWQKRNPASAAIECGTVRHQLRLSHHRSIKVLPCPCTSTSAHDNLSPTIMVTEMIGVVLAAALTASVQPIDSPANINRARAICEHHQLQPSPTSGYEPGWEACHKVRSKWLKQQAIEERQRQEQEKEDLNFVKSVADAP